MMNINITSVILLSLMTGSISAQSVTSIPPDTANDRFSSEYVSVIRPGLSLNGFDNTGALSSGLGLKQVLNAAISGDLYIKDKLNEIFLISEINLEDDNPSHEQIEYNSLILQYTAFEALASYVLEKNGITPSIAAQQGIVIRSHAVVMADLRAKLVFVGDLDFTLT